MSNQFSAADIETLRPYFQAVYGDLYAEAMAPGTFVMDVPGVPEFLGRFFVPQEITVLQFDGRRYDWAVYPTPTTIPAPTKHLKEWEIVECGGWEYLND